VAPPPGQPAKLRYEIFHDVLAPAILDWWARYVQAQKRAEAEKALAQERAEAERQAAEQQRQLEQAKALAEAERERAEERQRRILEQARSARRLRWLAAALALTALFAIGAATFAGLQLRKVNAAKNREKVSRDAAALSLNGDIEGALNKYNEAVKLYRDVGDHEGEVATLTAIARVYRSVDNQAETENYFKQAIEVGEQRLGPGSLTLANILAELALFYRGQKKFEQAEQLYGRALEVRVRAAGGRENEFVATSLQSLGTIYREWGRYYESKSIPEEAKRLYAKAEPFYEEALAIRRKVLPPSHPDVATSAYGLAQLYYLEGKYEQARPLYEEAVAIRRKILPNHPFLATTLLDYAKLLEKLQRHAEAASMMEESRRINENQ
jgi:tetratricopeptide (TPR) repeat protein